MRAGLTKSRDAGAGGTSYELASEMKILGLRFNGPPAAASKTHVAMWLALGSFGF